MNYICVINISHTILVEQYLSFHKRCNYSLCLIPINLLICQHLVYPFRHLQPELTITNYTFPQIPFVKTNIHSGRFHPITATFTKKFPNIFNQMLVEI